MRTLLLRTLATGVGLALLACGAAVADTVTTNFEPFRLASVNGQFGWHSAVPGDIPGLPLGYDQKVVSVSGGPASFGAQSLRHSNAYNEPTNEFEFQTYSSPTAQPAGEGVANTEYSAQFSFMSIKPDELQPGLYMSLSPDNSHGGRMSYVGLEDTDAGIDVWLVDTPQPGAGLKFEWHFIGTVPRDQPHTIRFWMKLNPGPDNDVLRLFLDGADVGQCFTTWENFYPLVPEPVPVSNSLLFLSRGQDLNTSLRGGGYLFDNVTIATGNGPGPQGCPDSEQPPEPPVDISKTTATRFARPGDRITYRVTVRNRGDSTVHGLRACDEPPRALAFVRSTPRLLRAAGRRLCLTIPVLRAGQRATFHATFRLRANVTAADVTNDASTDAILASAPSAAPPQGASSVPGASTVRRRRVARDSVRVRVVRAQACSARAPRAYAAC
jgi:uncharacterized repeat protein (TIGR01451 family)